MSNFIIRLASGSLFVTTIFFCTTLSNASLISLFAILYILCIYEFIKISSKKNLFLNILVLTLSFSILVFSENFGFNNKNQILIIFSAIWIFDSIAYLVGSKFGKNKMFIKISPKKSWEGFFSGFFAFLLYIYLVYLFAPDFLFEISSKIEILKFSLIPITAAAGDFYISHLKRKANLKDSGKLIPGHGGILDRMDSILFTFPILNLVI